MFRLSKNISLLKYVLWGFCLTGLSYVSGYSVRGAVGTVNFEIATMLTPWGILNNFFLDSENYLRPYYFNIAKAHLNIVKDPILLVTFLLFLAISLFVLLTMRKKNG